MSDFDYGAIDDKPTIIWSLSNEMTVIKDEYREGVRKHMNKAKLENRFIYTIEMYIWAVVNEISKWGKGVSIYEILDYSNSVYTKMEIYRAISNLSNGWYLLDKSYKSFKTDEGKEVAGRCWWISESTWDIGYFHPHSKAMRLISKDQKTEIRPAIAPLRQVLKARYESNLPE